ncbi:phosphoribosylanthranilate isomerase [Oscillatoria sp. FACHB-1406]|uniref:phosphoribosylanthranilate isomerase n=1 Tax=Oscillatoria sp. FACHB-1406 TaxID=2692846 RepID=UPI00168A0E82|nr:phosphoribosylanthranilate isomerase [Oscillatoria sp. FACHB-1406]MBD2579661.1 phosphoribosylanthranilate isomerase [Oscillatoria sp. FACHB-1406]
MRVKICGITRADQGCAIARLGATALGFICVPSSPRYIPLDALQEVTRALPTRVDRIGVFADASIAEICHAVARSGLTGVQLHGKESPDFCRKLRQALPDIEAIKALKIKTSESLALAEAYRDCTDGLLLDAYHPQQLGGTGQTLDWDAIATFNSPLPWFLAGGLNPDNITEALEQLKPNGIDLSSGVERSPGDKDLTRVAKLFERLRAIKTIE